jgi:hypothetical protein
MSVGLESPEEIVDDLLQALEAAAVSTTTRARAQDVSADATASCAGHPCARAAVT